MHCPSCIFVKKRKTKKGKKLTIQPETTAFQCGRCPYEAPSFCVTKSENGTHTFSLKKIPLLRVLVWQPQVFLVNHEVTLINTRFRLPMDFISHMANMLKFSCEKKYLFSLVIMICQNLICQNLQKYDSD